MLSAETKPGAFEFLPFLGIRTLNVCCSVELSTLTALAVSR